ncbi:hypothetical protein [Flammeovirga pacifica]|uniref:Uncharacterized protein n=1 Tax=Flammeovirga pacifica TaxID=915059 RepID=A0A1S1YT41_FLAPC|nr:hypothetical protein [Flammeovirga pacifica]OHX64190.1 hypothetical protein NH26_21540 [Flammeovirga pacifica]
MKNFTFTILILFSLSFYSYSQDISKDQELKIEEIDAEIKAAERKLSRNRINKTAGIITTGIGAFLFWPASIPGIAVWIAYPTKRWVREIQRLEDKKEMIQSK